MPSTDLSTYLYELLQAPQESCEIGTIIIISQKRKPRREEAKSPAEATPGRAPGQASLRSLLPLHLWAPGPAPQTPLPALFFPSLRWICTDLSNTHSLDLPTALQKSECPDLGVQSTAPEHSSIHEPVLHLYWVQSLKLSTMSPGPYPHLHGIPTFPRAGL